MTTENQDKPGSPRPVRPPDGAILLTYPEAAWILRCSVSHVYREIAAGKLATRRSGRKAFIHREDLDAYLAAIRHVERPAEQGASASAAERISLRASGLWDGDDFGRSRQRRRQS